MCTTYTHHPGPRGVRAEENEEAEKDAVGVVTYRERMYLKGAVSAIQTEREDKARRMRLTTLYGERITLGGGSRPVAEQSRAGYVATENGNL